MKQPSTPTTRRSPTAREQQSSYQSARLIAVRAWAFVGCAVCFALIIFALGMVQPALECFLVAVIVGFIASSVTNRLEKLGIGRGLGAFLALILVLGIICALLFFLGPLFIDQLSQLLSRIPTYFSRLQGYMQELWQLYGTEGSSQFQANLQEVVQGLSSVGTKMASDFAASLSSGVFPYIMSFTNGLLMFFLGLVLSYWFAKDYPVIFQELSVIAGPKRSDDLALLLTVLSRSMGGYMSGVVVTSFINGMLIFLGLTLIGHPYALLMGILTSLMHFIPVVGPMFSAALATLIGLFTSPVMALSALVLCVIAQNVTDNVISPLVMRSAVKIHPAMSLMGITLGACFGGALGMALAIPLTAAIKGAFIYYFESGTGRQLVSYDGAFFRGTPYHTKDNDLVPSADAVNDVHFPALTRLIEPDELEGIEACAPQPSVHHALFARLRTRVFHEKASKKNK